MAKFTEEYVPLMVGGAVTGALSKGAEYYLTKWGVAKLFQTVPQVGQAAGSLGVLGFEVALDVLLKKFGSRVPFLNKYAGSYWDKHFMKGLIAASIVKASADASASILASTIIPNIPLLPPALKTAMLKGVVYTPAMHGIQYTPTMKGLVYSPLSGVPQLGAHNPADFGRAHRMHGADFGEYQESPADYGSTSDESIDEPDLSVDGQMG